MKLPSRNIRWGLWAAIIVFCLILLFPQGSDLSGASQKMLAVLLLMAILWMTEAIPLAITSLLPLVLYPALGIMKTAAVAPNYANHLIFLFLGGFMIAIALQEWKLHKRFALKTIAMIGGSPSRMILAFMLSAMVLSMWISNTATTLMMLPIALAVIDHFQEGEDEQSNFGLVLMLGLAYSASVGGIATLIGTPPNVVFSGIFGSYFPNLPEVSFVNWMIMALPLSLILFAIIWFYLVVIILNTKTRPTKNKDHFLDQYRQLGKMNSAQKWVLWVFSATALLWLWRADVHLGSFILKGWPTLLGLSGKIQDSTIAIGMASLLFLIPAKKGNTRRMLLNWENLQAIPWDILILFGGGFALANGIHATGLDVFIGHKLTFLSHIPLLLMLILLSLSVALLTEFTSNTAVATTILPILAALSVDLHLNPLLLMVPATVAASCAFMLPVATPPNAIVFGSRLIPIKSMVRIGIALIIIVSLVVGSYFYVVFSFF